MNDMDAECDVCGDVPGYLPWTLIRNDTKGDTIAMAYVCSARCLRKAPPALLDQLKASHG